MSVSGKRIGVIARREYRATVRRREFLLITFGMPLFYLAVVAIVAVTTASATIRSEKRNASSRLPRVVGFHDATSGRLNPNALTTKDDDLQGKLYATEDAGKEAVRKGDIRAFVDVPAAFAENGEITVYLPPARESLLGPSRSAGGVDTATIARKLRRALLTGRTDAATINAVLQPIDSNRLNWDPEQQKFARPDPLRSMARFVIPYAFSLLLMMAVLFSSSYLLHGVVEEKENRIIEVLLSSASHEELLAGKLLGLGAAGLTQLGIWLGSGLLLGGSARMLLPLPPGLSLDSFTVGPGLVATAVLLFLTGFGQYAALMVGVGSFGTSWRESQQISGMLTLPIVIPLMFIPIILDEPNGPLARTLSLIPLTAPVGMILRVAAGGASFGEVALALLLVAFTTAGAVYLSARLFRLSLLLYGQRPSYALIWRYLRNQTT